MHGQRAQRDLGRMGGSSPDGRSFDPTNRSANADSPPRGRHPSPVRGIAKARGHPLNVRDLCSTRRMGDSVHGRSSESRVLAVTGCSQPTKPRRRRGGAIYEGRHNPPRSPIWTWSADNVHVVAGVLDDLLPYVCARHAEAEILRP